MNYSFVIIPIVSAIFGWVGALLTAKIFLYKIIPTRQQSLAAAIGKSAATAFSFTDLEKKITDPEGVKKIMPIVETHVDDFLRNKLKEKMPVIGMFIGNKTIDSLKEVFLKEIEELFPQVLKQFAGNLQAEFNIETMVANKITNVSPGRIEKAILPALNYFQLSGAITGLVIGIINLLLFILIK